MNRFLAFVSIVALTATVVTAQESFRYKLPAEINDFPNGADKLAEMQMRWHYAMDAFTKMAIAGNPWSGINDSPRSNYQDPTVAPPPEHPVQPITWTAFPNRVAWYFSRSQDTPYNVPDLLLYPLADVGRLDPEDEVLAGWARTNGLEGELRALVAAHPGLADDDPSNFAPVSVPDDVCPMVNWSQDRSEWVQFGPQGPRGWKDEYNEWVVTRNDAGQITRISFTAENPEYWFTLWAVDPQRVLELYRELVGNGVAIEDLYLTDSDGNVVRDYDGEPFYNPLNKWNYGNVATAEGGGAVHLTSPPNTVGAEIYLGGAATILRDLDDAEYSPAANICSSRYGQIFRNSDPNIGFQANQVVRNLGASVTLTNPIALYMQRPDFSNYATPDGTPAEDFFTIVRGRDAEAAGVGYDQILHAVFEVPEERGYTVSDITIGGHQIWWGSQVAETFNQALAATAYASATPPSNQLRYPAVGTLPEDARNGAAQPMAPVAALRAIAENPDIASATVPLLPPVVGAGTTLTDVALEAGWGAADATIEFVGPDGTVADGIVVTVKSTYEPEDADGSEVIYVLDVAVGEVADGLYGVRVTNPGRVSQIAMPAGLIVASDP